jgi:hypothetical protein
MVTLKIILKIAILYFIVTSITGCARYNLQWYSAEPDSMTCFRKELKASKSQISLAIEGEDKQIHIPLIYRSRKVRSPYSVRFVINTDNLLYDSVLLTKATFTNKAGEIFSLIEDGKTLELNFSGKKYSGYAQKEAFQAESILPKEINVDYDINPELTISVDYYLISKSKKYRENAKAVFYATHEKGFRSIFQTYTN